jgi:MPBQ/MSBQ methyltransferase
MDVVDRVRGHYSGGDLEGTILGALAEHGIDIDRLTVDDLATLDHLHAGFLPATEHLLAQLDLAPDQRLLDVGAGIGGPARLAADRYGCTVEAVDLSPEFVSLGQSLTSRVGLVESVHHHVGTGEALEFDDGSFDRAMLIHVGMNLADKAAVFAEVRRVLAAGGLFGLYDQMRVSDGALAYPLPWAKTEESSFVETPETYGDLLERAGFAVEATENRMAAVARPPGGSTSPLNPVLVFGPRFTEGLDNSIAATRAGILAPVLIVARAH